MTTEDVTTPSTLNPRPPTSSPSNYFPFSYSLLPPTLLVGILYPDFSRSRNRHKPQEVGPFPPPSLQMTPLR